eukprot:CAMPEP_0172787598 /NCGR_PEP_ID=MMETSP1074-20121228/206532_1 /TAXON_ID=2916 /ORGANISM="Ceratium fusus, Strain PA161109" /LENGTH=492 /DNA_ID=CAMNT_0013624621 /DNA_START=262 /DNA_END=1741 /DNA_ORIENTATION=-
MHVWPSTVAQSNEAPPALASRCTGSAAGTVLEGDDKKKEEIGCTGAPAHSSSDSSKYDVTCMTASSSMCRGGLPFYKYSQGGMTADSCFDFCLKKGLDLFGVLSSLECRCGASRINKGVWGDAKPRKPLQFVPDDLTACTGAQEFKVHRYIGHFEASCLPSASVHVGVSDAVYIKSIVAGKRIHQEPVNKALPPPAASQGSSSGSLRSCLSGCGPAFNWDNRLSDPPSGLDEKENKWKEYVKIAYKFNYDIDDDRKEAFRWAAKDWLNKTCLLFREETNPSEPYVTVVKEDLEYCWAILGKPRSTPSKVNMGWCNSLNQRGSIVHELGHVAGMLHEQSRPDASGTVAGHGPYLKIHWQNIASDWRSQWAPSMGSYVGSADDGHGDPHVGYSEYDYDSLMHYACEDMDGKKCEKMYPSKGGSIGQRVGLSQGDVQQILDMYQCKPREGGGGGCGGDGGGGTTTRKNNNLHAIISLAGGFGPTSTAMLIAFAVY